MTDRKIMSISLPPDVAERLDQWAKEKRVNRSQMVAQMVTAYMDAEEARPTVMQLADGLGNFMQNLFSMTPEEAKRRMAEIDFQMESLPETVKDSAKKTG